MFLTVPREAGAKGSIQGRRKGLFIVHPYTKSVLLDLTLWYLLLAPPTWAGPQLCLLFCCPFPTSGCEKTAKFNLPFGKYLKGGKWHQCLSYFFGFHLHFKTFLAFWNSYFVAHWHIFKRFLKCIPEALVVFSWSLSALLLEIKFFQLAL